MVSKMVTDRQKTARALASALTEHAAGAHARFSDLVQPYLREEEQTPDLVLFQELLQRHLAAVRENLVGVDTLHHWEQLDDQQVRAKRDQAVLDLSSLLVRLRSTVKGACGAGSYGTVLGVEEYVPRDPEVLQRYASLVKERLETGSLDAQTLTLEGVSIDATPWIRLIEEPLSRLSQALDLLSGEKRGTIESQLAKNALMADYDRAFRNGAQILQSLFRFVGMDELAERVRPSSNRRLPQGPQPEESSPEEPRGEEIEVSPPPDPRFLTLLSSDSKPERVNGALPGSREDPSSA